MSTTPAPAASAREPLKPCPFFCGRHPQVTERASGPSEGVTKNSKFACFISCHCGGYSARAHQPGFGDTPEEARAIATTAWNTRIPSPDEARTAPAEPPAGVVEAMQECVDFLRDEKRLTDWDRWRKYIADGGGGSWPRDAYEATLDWVVETLTEALTPKERPDAALLCEKLKALMAKATPGPWFVATYCLRPGTPDQVERGMMMYGDDDGDDVSPTGIIDEKDMPGIGADSVSHDLDLIAELVNNLPHILAALSRDNGADGWHVQARSFTTWLQVLAKEIREQKDDPKALKFTDKDADAFDALAAAIEADTAILGATETQR